MYKKVVLRLSWALLKCTRISIFQIFDYFWYNIRETWGIPLWKPNFRVFELQKFGFAGTVTGRVEQVWDNSNGICLWRTLIKCPYSVFMHTKWIGRLPGAQLKCTRIWKKAEFLVSIYKENLANPIVRAEFSGFLAPNRYIQVRMDRGCFRGICLWGTLINYPYLS